LLLAACFALIWATGAMATTYYVDSVGGNDLWNGTSTGTPWQSLTKVTATTFSPGDHILLKCGSVWNGQLLWPKGSGASGNPIIINSYSTGAKPQINANLVYNVTVGAISQSTAVHLYNQSYWEINNLEITNTGTPGDYVHGVFFAAEETGQAHNHIYLKDCYVHNVSANLGRGSGRDKGKNNGGVVFDVYGASVAGTKFNDVRVENCTFTYCGGSGIKTWSDQFNYQCHTPWTPITGFVAKNNVLDHIDGDGIVASMTQGAVIEYNAVSWSHLRVSDPYVAIWNYESDDTLMQFNECYLTQTDTDGQGFDIDDYTERTTVQYNYSHDNVGGFILIIGIKTARGKCGTCDENVVRYNISQNDGAEITKFAGRSEHTDFYNNVFYHAAGGTVVADILRLSDSVDAHVYNNIFETWTGTNFLQPDFGVDQGFDFRRNVIYGNEDYGNWPTTYPNNLWNTNPLFVNPGTGGVGRGTCGGYMLQAGSPAINYGIWSNDAGLMALPEHAGSPLGENHGTQDYFGNALSGTIDAGAHEYGGGGGNPPVANFTGNPTSGTAPLTVMFTDTSTNNPTSWSWVFGDGGTATTQNPSHIYNSAGSYTVTLTATNQYGSDGETKNNYISVSAPGQPPVAQFVGNPTSGAAPLAVAFTDQSTNSPTSWSWVFGDGSTSTAQNPSHTYAAGTYTVTLTATNQYGSDGETKTNYITASSGGNPPVAQFVGNPTSGAAPLAVAFTDQSTNSPTSWSWVFGDGSTSTAQNPSHTYAAGTYTVTLTATNAYGSDGETKTNYITATGGGGSAPTFVAAGTVAAGSGTITPGLPAGIQTNDILLLFLETANQTITISNQNGGTWAQVTGSPQGTGTVGGSSSTMLTVFWSRYNGTQGAPTASDSGNHQIGRIIAVRGCPTSGNPWDVTAGGVDATEDTSGSIPGATTTVANTLVVTAIASSRPDLNGTAAFSAWTNANLTGLTERVDNTTTSSNGGGIGVATGTKATAGAYGATAVTVSEIAFKGLLSIALKPA
jgi:PKD repeat protein